MNNKDIIKIVENLASIEGFVDIIEDEDEKKNRNFNKNYTKDGEEKKKRCIMIGTSQFRDIANVCKRTQCCEEIKLFIQYKTSKGNGWNNLIGDKYKEKFGALVIKSISEIENNFEKSDDESKKIEAISKFFGYLFWKAKVVKNN